MQLNDPKYSYVYMSIIDSVTVRFLRCFGLTSAFLAASREAEEGLGPRRGVGVSTDQID